MFLESLAIVLDFSESDLVANQNGYLSQPQREKLRRAALTRTIGFGLVGLVSMSLLVATVRDTISQSNVTSGNWVSLFAFSSLAAVTAFFYFYYVRLIRFDLGINGVVSTIGPISLGIFDTKTIRYKLQINNVELEVPKQAHSILIKGEVYKVYYAPRSKIILSIEKPD